jgi:Calcineurin-like phosphoesterase
VAQSNEAQADVPVVTLRSMQPPRSAAAEGTEAAAAVSDGTQARYDGAVEKIAEETERVGADVLITVQNREVSLLQSSIADRAEERRALPGGGVEAQFGEGLTGGDWWGWIRSVFDHIDKKDWHPIVRPPDEKVGSIPDSARVAILGDWGTNLYGAPASAASIRKAGVCDLLLHLGDIYYSGTPKEVKQRFLDVWPTDAANVSRALNGNHEMYSGGLAYFDDILPRLKQPSSYFAMQNAHWLLVGLDTAHKDHALDEKQVAWLMSVVQKAKPRKVILLSHHQPFSRLDEQGPNLQAALANLLASKAITAWYWGHEHNCIIYDKHGQFGLLGRCIGHGGIPAPRKMEVRDAHSERVVGDVAWKRLGANGESPSCLVLDGENPLVKGEAQKFGPHGYATLAFDGPHLTERVHLPDGTEIYKGKLV